MRASYEGGGRGRHQVRELQLVYMGGARGDDGQQDSLRERRRAPAWPVIFQVSAR
ncbi:hypothetical protein AB0M29_37530 [Streptomyces sp. NPDC051976]|uniref:hypothetical protein n=1 Tax=Streptomyces sp. NPDC051976 TaxID=3154947 RepID=UPI00342D053E